MHKLWRISEQARDRLRLVFPPRGLAVSAPDVGDCGLGEAGQDHVVEIDERHPEPRRETSTERRLPARAGTDEKCVRPIVPHRGQCRA